MPGYNSLEVIKKKIHKKMEVNKMNMKFELCRMDISMYQLKKSIAKIKGEENKDKLIMFDIHSNLTLDELGQEFESRVRELYRVLQEIELYKQEVNQYEPCVKKLRVV